MRIFLFLLGLTILLITACGEKFENKHNGIDVAPSTGKSDDLLITKAIGPEGGTLISKDQKMIIYFPEGALSSFTDISLEIIENTNPSGIGYTYKILPSDIELLKPVKISFFFENKSLSGFPETLFPSYQDHEGAWQAIQGELDTEKKLISLYTKKTGSWCLFEALQLESSASILKPGDSLTLKVYHYLPHEYFFNTNKESYKIKTLPVITKTKMNDDVKWKIIGDGVLLSKGSEAKFLAHNDLPNQNPIEIKALLKNFPGVLSTKIYIAHKGISLKVDNGPWLYSTLPKSETMYGIHQIAAPVFDTDEATDLVIFWNSSDLKMDWNLDFPHFKLIRNNLQYFQYYSFEGQNIASPGYFEIFDLEKTEDYVAGKFYLEKSGIYDTNVLEGEPFKNTSKIEGIFWVKKKHL